MNYINSFYKSVCLICLFILFIGNVHAGRVQHMQSGVVSLNNKASGGCESCNTTNDSELITSGNTNDNTFSVGSMRAWQFVVGSDICSTGAYIYAGDGGSGYDLIMQVWTDNSGEPGAIYGAGFTGTYSNLPDSVTKIEVTYAATQELPAGTYWRVWGSQMTLGVTGDAITYGNITTGSGTFMYDAGGAWAATGNELDLGELGCTP